MSEPDQTSETPAKRLFFALWPDDALRQKLHALGEEILGNCSMRCSTSAIPGVVGNHRGRRIPPENLHLTLAFLGSVDAERQACLERMALAIRSPAFTLTLDQAGFWPRKGLLWAGGTSPAELLALVQEINQCLRTCGLVPETRPYQVHLTLARNVRGLRLDRDRAVVPLAWKVSQFALVASQTLPEGACYEVLRTWKLE
ncbi:MAG: RNA 2',3'-cyclic phosphodiesterase [Pseudomonadota bacterium]